jgi:hypothetical protein
MGGGGFRRFSAHLRMCTWGIVSGARVAGERLRCCSLSKSSDSDSFLAVDVDLPVQAYVKAQLAPEVEPTVQSCVEGAEMASQVSRAADTGTAQAIQTCDPSSQDAAEVGIYVQSCVKGPRPVSVRASPPAKQSAVTRLLAAEDSDGPVRQSSTDAGCCGSAVLGKEPCVKLLQQSGDIRQGILSSASPAGDSASDKEPSIRVNLKRPLAAEVGPSVQTCVKGAKTAVKPSRAAESGTESQDAANVGVYIQSCVKGPRAAAVLATLPAEVVDMAQSSLRRPRAVEDKPSRRSPIATYAGGFGPGLTNLAQAGDVRNSARSSASPDRGSEREPSVQSGGNLKRPHTADVGPSVQSCVKGAKTATQPVLPRASDRDIQGGPSRLVQSSDSGSPNMGLSARSCVNTVKGQLAPEVGAAVQSCVKGAKASCQGSRTASTGPAQAIQSRDPYSHSAAEVGAHVQSCVKGAKTAVVSSRAADVMGPVKPALGV